jgi:hypothetical protein
MTETNHIVVNFFSGPGGGKTAAAAALFVELKRSRVEVLLVGEFAQECVLAGNEDALRDQLFIFGNTYHRVSSAYQQATVTIVDSPILLSCVYQNNLPPIFNQLVIAIFNQFQNFNILLDVREEDYQHTMVGRVHSLQESLQLDGVIKARLDEYEIDYVSQSQILEEQKELIPYLAEQILEYLEEPTVVE